MITQYPELGSSTDNQLEVSVNKSFGDLTVDAWGVPKMSISRSLLHGMFTFDIPSSHWFMFHGSTQVYSSTNIKSTLGSAEVTANSTNPSVTLQSRECPRYQPNRGQLFSTALWCPNKTNAGVREWGVSTAENGVFFRLKSDGFLYAVRRSGGVEVVEQLIDTSIVPEFDVQKGNTYDIQYQWRGVGDYRFFINLVHVATFANLGKLTVLSMENPAIPATFKSARTSQDVSIFMGCVDVSSENGDDDTLQPKVAYATANLNGTNVPVLTIYNPLTIAGVTNTRTVYLAKWSFTCDKKAVFKVWRHRDPALLTGETFATIGSGSFVQTDSPDTVAGAVRATAASVTTMELLDVINLQPNASETAVKADFRLDLYLARGDYLTVTVTTINGLCDATIGWGEAI